MTNYKSPNIALHFFQEYNTPPLAKSRLPRAEYCMMGGCSAVGYKSIVGNIVPYGVGEGDAVAIGNSRSIDTSTLELVDKSLIMIGSHRGPATVLDLGVKNGY